ncbi:hypothetical protein C4D60_Mb05t27300 [Musa balbisiana]|uniref:Uncharacterized protein n=1 Tax=Musa balbisiana TaxID=52838 RepID=A0A4S8JZ70_MUSBA|nr:hypothetical protein C4D60_Mb05t27300 [Musa balbisiana]
MSDDVLVLAGFVIRAIQDLSSLPTQPASGRRGVDAAAESDGGGLDVGEEIFFRSRSMVSTGTPLLGPSPPSVSPASASGSVSPSLRRLPIASSQSFTFFSCDSIAATCSRSDGTGAAASASRNRSTNSRNHARASSLSARASSAPSSSPAPRSHSGNGGDGGAVPRAFPLVADANAGGGLGLD